MLQRILPLVFIVHLFLINQNCIAGTNEEENSIQLSISKLSEANTVNFSPRHQQHSTLESIQHDEEKKVQELGRTGWTDSQHLNVLNNDPYQEPSARNRTARIYPSDDLGPLDSVIDKCSRLSSRTKIILSILPDITFFTLLTTSLLVDNESVLMWTKFLTFPYSLYFLGMSPKRLKICFPNACGSR